MKEQLDDVALSQVVEKEREDKIAELEAQLAQAEANAQNNKSAADILTDLMSKGKVVQQSDGSFGVTNNANVIGNEDDGYD